MGLYTYITWNATFAGSVPASGDQVSAGPDRFHDTKQQTELRLTTEVNFGSGYSSNDSGRNRLGSARPFYQNTAPAALISSVVDAAGSSALDSGRLWIDTDDLNRLWVYDLGSTSWKPVTAQAGIYTEAVENTAATYAASAWRTVASVSVTTPTAFTNSAKWQVIVTGKFVGYGNGAGQNAAVDIYDGATSLDQSALRSDASGAPNTAYVSASILSPAAATTYTFDLRVYPQAGTLFTQGYPAGVTGVAGGISKICVLLSPVADS